MLIAHPCYPGHPHKPVRSFQVRLRCSLCLHLILFVMHAGNCAIRPSLSKPGHLPPSILFLLQLSLGPSPPLLHARWSIIFLTTASHQSILKHSMMSTGALTLMMFRIGSAYLSAIIIFSRRHTRSLPLLVFHRLVRTLLGSLPRRLPRRSLISSGLGKRDARRVHQIRVLIL